MKQSHHLRIRITEQQFENLKSVLIKEQLTPSTLIRKLIDSYIIKNTIENEDDNNKTKKQ